MDEWRRIAFTRVAAQLASRRSAVLSLVVAGASSALGLSRLASHDAEAKRRKNKKKRRRRRRRKRQCVSPRRRCDGACMPLDTSEHCGRCGNRCQGAETCRDGVCCAQPLCRGECRADCPPPPTVNFPFPQELGYGAIQPSRSQPELNADVEAAYRRWKARYLVREDRDTEGHLVFRITFGKPGTPEYSQTVSEGQGFGMMIVAIMAGYEEEAQEIFDGLWRFRQAHPSRFDPRLMDWKVPEGGGNDSAFDGDADIAYALLLADAQWGSAGAINYLEEARTVIAGIKASTIGADSMLPMLGDWVQPDGGQYNQNTPRTSDFMPGHFRAFGSATDDVAFWDAVVEACHGVIEEIQETYSPQTGLLPDFAVLAAAGFAPARPGFLEGAHDGDYNYNAGRDPWRLGTAALLDEDETSASQAAKMTIWANAETGGNLLALRSGYRLDGTTWRETDYFSTFFAAPLGVAAMTDPSLQSWLNAVYDAVYDVQENYYEDTVTLLCLLVMTGNFWKP